jgi:hypothetical protein
MGVALLGGCFLREAPEGAIGSDRRAGKWGLVSTLKTGADYLMHIVEHRVLQKKAGKEE